MKIEGIANYVDSNGKRHSIEGIGSLPGGTELQSLNASGSLSFDNLDCKEFKIEGECQGKSINAKNISVSGTFDVHTVKTEKDLKIEGTLDSENVIAEEIIMESRDGLIGEIKCNKIKIFHGEIHDIGGSILSGIFGKKFQYQGNSRVRIEKIDADTVNLQNCEVTEIKCTDAIIGSNCAIKKLIVSGKYKVAENSTVGEVIQD